MVWLECSDCFLVFRVQPLVFFGGDCGLVFLDVMIPVEIVTNSFSACRRF